MYIPSDVLHLHPILNQFDNWLWRCCISRTDLADTESVVTNAVVLVRGECQMSMTIHLREYLPLYRVILKHIGN